MIKNIRLYKTYYKKIHAEYQIISVIIYKKTVVLLYNKEKLW